MEMNKALVGWMAGMMVAATAATASAQTAAPIVKDGIGIRLTENFNRFLESQLENRDVVVDKPNIYKQNVSCFDEVGVNNAHVATHIDHATFDWNGSDAGLALTVDLADLDLSGQLYGLDSDTFDLCPSFSVNVTDIHLSNVHLSMDLSPRADGNYNVYITFNQPPQISATGFDIDVAGFPDAIIDFVTSQDFVQNFIWSTMNDVLAQKIPDMVRDAIITGMFTGNLGGFDYGIGATAIGIDDNGANALFDTQVSYSGPRPSCVPSNVAMPTFDTRGTPGLGANGDVSQVELSVADSAVNELLWAVWSSGMLCYNSESHPLEQFDQILEGISPQAGEMLKYDIQISQPPTLRFDADKTTVTINGFHLEADAIEPDGTSKVLLLADADLSMGMKIDLDVATNRVLATMDGMDLEFQNLSSQILFSDKPSAEDDLKQFIKGYVVPRMMGQVQNMPVSNAVLPVQGYYVILDELKGREGHAVAGVSVYAANDPAIDTIAPDTFVDGNPGVVHATTATVSFHGQDDRSGSLVYAWRLDGTAWSAWSDAAQADLSALTKGTHTFEVKARDRFQNEDPSPASIDFTVAEKAKNTTNAYFGCDVAEGSRADLPAGAVASLAGALLLGLAIRRRASAGS